MKTFKLYLSFMKTFLKSGIKLNLSILFISAAAVLSFVAAISCLRSSRLNYARVGLPYYQIELDSGISDEIPRFLKNDMPGIIWGRMGASHLSYLSRDGRTVCDECYYTAFPKAWEEAFLYLNEPYTVYEGRDLTEEERNTESGVIIASKDSMRRVGDSVVIPLDGFEVTLTVVGISDSFILPSSFIAKYGAAFDDPHDDDRTFLTFPNFRLAFERALGEEENMLLCEKLGHCFYDDNSSEDIAAIALIYAVTVLIIAITSVFAAIQVYTLFLYLASKVSYQTAVCGVCGCLPEKITAVMLMSILTYVAAAFAAGALLMPLFGRISTLCRLNYIPTFFDFLLSFAVYAAIVLAASLPGIRRISNTPLVKGVR